MLIRPEWNGERIDGAVGRLYWAAYLFAGHTPCSAALVQCSTRIQVLEPMFGPAHEVTGRVHIPWPRKCASTSTPSFRVIPGSPAIGRRARMPIPTRMTSRVRCHARRDGARGHPNVDARRPRHLGGASLPTDAQGPQTAKPGRRSARGLSRRQVDDRDIAAVLDERCCDSPPTASGFYHSDCTWVIGHAACKAGVSWNAEREHVRQARGTSPGRWDRPGGDDDGSTTRPAVRRDDVVEPATSSAVARCSERVSNPAAAQSPRTDTSTPRDRGRRRARSSRSGRTLVWGTRFVADDGDAEVGRDAAMVRRADSGDRSSDDVGCRCGGHSDQLPVTVLVAHTTPAALVRFGTAFQAVDVRNHVKVWARHR